MQQKQKYGQYETKQWYNPIITTEKYAELVYAGLQNFNAYLDSLGPEFLEKFYEYSGVDYINKTFDEIEQAVSLAEIKLIDKELEKQIIKIWSRNI